MIRALGRHRPVVADGAFVYFSAQVIGRVSLGRGVSVWPGAVLRGDLEPIVVGAGSNVQDNAVAHTDRGTPTIVGRRVTVGHGAILHSCRVGDGAMIGMGAIVLNGAVVGESALVGAGAVVTRGSRVPPGTLVVGSPARKVRSLTSSEKRGLLANARRYVVLGQRYKTGGFSLQ